MVMPRGGDDSRTKAAARKRLSRARERAGQLRVNVDLFDAARDEDWLRRRGYLSPLDEATRTTIGIAVSLAFAQMVTSDDIGSGNVE